MPPRLHPDRPLTNQEKQARRYQRVKEARAYVAALEAAVCDAEWHYRTEGLTEGWLKFHAPTIARARAGRQAREED